MGEDLNFLSTFKSRNSSTFPSNTVPTRPTAGVIASHWKFAHTNLNLHINWTLDSYYSHHTLLYLLQQNHYYSHLNAFTRIVIHIEIHQSELSNLIKLKEYFHIVLAICDSSPAHPSISWKKKCHMCNAPQKTDGLLSHNTVN